MNCIFCNKITIDARNQPFTCKECTNHEILVYFYPGLNCTVLRSKKYSMTIYDYKTYLYSFNPVNPVKTINFTFKINVTPDSFEETVSKLLKLKAYY